MSPATPARPGAASISRARSVPAVPARPPPAHPRQSCIKRGLAATCAYPDPDPNDTPAQFAPPPVYAAQYYSDYNGAYTGASTSTFRTAKRPRTLTDQEAAAIRNYTRGDFFIGNNAPVRIDTRLPVRLTLGDADQVHFTIGESL